MRILKWSIVFVLGAAAAAFVAGLTLNAEMSAAFLGRQAKPGFGSIVVLKGEANVACESRAVLDGIAGGKAALPDILSAVRDLGCRIVDPGTVGVVTSDDLSGMLVRLLRNAGSFR